MKLGEEDNLWQLKGSKVYLKGNEGPTDEGPAEDDAGGSSKVGGEAITVEEIGEEEEVVGKGVLEGQWRMKVEWKELESEQEKEQVALGAQQPLLQVLQVLEVFSSQLKRIHHKSELKEGGPKTKLISTCLI
ncbi:hypothetical protein Taro_048267 [Colocasia esculenta]|uniref:Uncharacterized protein n=1 Tax=Colocasia esculenta TaxID=4460 RepID=A0A843X7S0_COLES|nr:hypothetical protein [Colocasia esculenta]